jgi:protein-serine/threonine kinase
MANYAKGVWPSGPSDQETPKASRNGEQSNPFDQLSGMGANSARHDVRPGHSREGSTGASSSSKSGGGNAGLTASYASSDLSSSSGLRTPGALSSHAAIPTTSISTTAPDFSMQLPPPKARLDGVSTGSSTPVNSNATRNTSAPRGRLAVKLIEGRNLHKSVAQPYAVISFEQNELIARNPIPQKSQGPHNPVWEHEAFFDVVQADKAIYISIYDRDAEEEGFLGMRLIRPRLVHGATSDQWYNLLARDDAEGDEQQGRGEIRVRVSYEKSSHKKHLTPADFEFLKLIGRGTFGRVFQVRKKDTKRIYAMKVLSKREIAIKKEVTHTMGERKILEKSLDCPFLVGLKFSFQSAHELYFVTDYKSGGELFWHLQREGRFTEERARFYIAELVLALEHLHKYDIVYRDLKPENILLDATGHVALCDFGLSKPDLGAGQLTNTFCGTTEYLAPEVLLDESGYSKLVDFWSLGVLLFEMCCGWSPFYAEDTQQMYRNICFGKIKFPRGAIGDDGKQFVKGLLNRNPKHRLGAVNDAKDLREHSFFKDIDFDALSKKQLTPPFKPSVESDESVANFDPEFTETDLKEMAFIPGFDGDANGAENAIKTGGILGESTNGGKATGALDINGRPMNDEEEDELTRSIQDKFRGFSYSGTYDGSVAGSFGGRRGSGGFGGLGGASLGMSRMSMDDHETGEHMTGMDGNGRRQLSAAELEAASRHDVDMDR